MKKIFKDKIIFITGAGSIGEELLAQIIKFDIDSVRIFDNSELKLHTIKERYKNDKRIKIILGDIRDRDRLSIAMRDVDIVFHTAALKHVSFCEDNPIDAVKTNVFGTQNLIDVCIKENVEKLINISTDKATNPINVMGATKLLSERMIVSACSYKGKIGTIFANVRFGNVLGSSGSVVPIFRKQIKEKKEITVTNENMTRFMMLVDDAVRLIFKATEIAKDGDIFILKMPSVRIMDLANAMINKYGKEDIKIHIIGMQEGEKMHESLLTDEEAYMSYENDELIVIPHRDNISYYIYNDFNKMDVKNVSSDDNEFLTIEEIMVML